MKLIIVLLVSMFLSACGAGAGGDDALNTTADVGSQTPIEEEGQNPVEIAPVQISSQPQSLTVEEGENASFSISATGGGILSFQWRKDEQNIAGATGNTLVLASVTESDAALYDVVVSNSVGNQYSLAALLTVTTPVVIVDPTDEPIVIVSQPQALTVAENAAASFSVQVTGDGAITYQWLKDGEVLSGASSASLNITNVVLADAATYSVVVTNSQGSVVSESAALSVTPVQLTSSIELSWDIPQAREDGSALDLYEINGYVIAYGTDQNDLSNQVTVDGASVQSKIVENLVNGTYYFAIATVDSDGVQGAYSGVIEQSI